MFINIQLSSQVQIIILVIALLDVPYLLQLFQNGYPTSPLPLHFGEDAGSIILIRGTRMILLKFYQGILRSLLLRHHLGVDMFIVAVLQKAVDKFSRLVRDRIPTAIQIQDRGVDLFCGDGRTTSFMFRKDTNNVR